MSDVEIDVYYDCNGSPTSFNSLSLPNMSPAGSEKVGLNVSLRQASTDTSSSFSFPLLGNKGKENIDVPDAGGAGGGSGGGTKLTPEEKAILRKAYRLMEEKGIGVMDEARWDGDGDGKDGENVGGVLTSIEEQDGAPEEQDGDGVTVVRMDISRLDLDELEALREPQIELETASVVDFEVEKERVRKTAEVFAQKTALFEEDVREGRIRTGVGLTRRAELDRIWDATVKAELAKARAARPAEPLKKRWADFKMLNVVRMDHAKTNVKTAAKNGWEKVKTGGKATGEFVVDHKAEIAKLTVAGGYMALTHGPA